MDKTMKEKLLLIWNDPDSKTGYTIGELIKMIMSIYFIM